MMHVMNGLDTLLITVGILFLIVRRFFWREIEPTKLLRLPLLMIGLGVAWMVWDVVSGATFDLISLGVVGFEAILVCGTGLAMGLMTQFRRSSGHVSYRLLPTGGLLWLVFLAIRIGSFILADKLGFHLLDTTGAILVSFGINRLAAALVIRHKLRQQESLETAGQPNRSRREVLADSGQPSEPLIR